MLRTSQESPVMKSGCKMKDFADEVVLAKPAFIFDNTQPAESTRVIMQKS